MLKKVAIPRTEPEGSAIRMVLVVDDSRLQRRILSSSLRRDGYVVQEAASGPEALRICRKTAPDLILSDLVMPGMDGLEFCQAFRALPCDDYGYFILLTSKSDKEEMVRGLEGGADDFLSKPVNAQELRARISAGERILRMQRELTEKNRLISETLTELQQLYDSLDHDLIEAKKLQQSLVRERFKDFGTGAVSLELRSSGHVGGDLVGQYRIGETHVGLYAIDVSGHGISSALMTARLAGYLSSSSAEQNVALRSMPDGSSGYLPPHEVIGFMNRIVLEEMDTELYFTMLIAVVDLQTGRTQMAQAGHPHPVIVRADGVIEQAGPGGLPVGLIEGAEFVPFETELGVGDRLVILSDGVTECPDRHDAMLGEDGLADLLRSLAGQSVETMLDAMIWRLGEFAGADQFPDDISGILFEYRGKPC